MVIKIKDNMEIDIKKLTREELEAIVSIKLDIAEAELKKSKIKIYCKNPKCFIHYLANHKIKEKEDVKKGGKE